jgi:hypothetical protein
MRYTSIGALVACLVLSLTTPLHPAAADPMAGGRVLRPALSAADADGKFSIAIYPDTQNEVFAGDNRLVNRSNTVVSLKTLRDYRFVIHTGDITNWGWLDQSQFEVAKKGMKPLQNAGLPYSIALGNHDTGAVGWNGIGREYGGGAYMFNPECKERLGSECQTEKLLRRTTEFNANFTVAQYRNVWASYEPKKIENVYSIFEAAGKKWLVLTLELWPRPEVVNWAKTIVSRFPSHNVIVATHSYLNADGSISKGREYGATTPQYLYDNLISKYKNIKLVFSGHVGTFATRTDTPNGNRVVSYLQAMHSGKPDAPFRTVEIDVKLGRVRTAMVNATTGRNYPNSDPTYTGMKFV